MIVVRCGIPCLPGRPAAIELHGDPDVFLLDRAVGSIRVVDAVVLQPDQIGQGDTFRHAGPIPRVIIDFPGIAIGCPDVLAGAVRDEDDVRRVHGMAPQQVPEGDEPVVVIRHELLEVGSHFQGRAGEEGSGDEVVDVPQHQLRRPRDGDLPQKELDAGTAGRADLLATVILRVAERHGVATQGLVRFQGSAHDLLGVIGDDEGTAGPFMRLLHQPVEGGEIGIVSELRVRLDIEVAAVAPHGLVLKVPCGYLVDVRADARCSLDLIGEVGEVAAEIVDQAAFCVMGRHARISERVQMDPVKAPALHGGEILAGDPFLPAAIGRVFLHDPVDGPSPVFPVAADADLVGGRAGAFQAAPVPEGPHADGDVGVPGRPVRIGSVPEGIELGEDSMSAEGPDQPGRFLTGDGDVLEVPP